MSFKINPTEQKPQQSIVWLASYPKSGNTWLRMFFEVLMSGAKSPPDLSKPLIFTRFSDMSPELYLNQSNKQLGLLTTEEVVRLRQNSHVRLSNLGKPVLAKTHFPDMSFYNHQVFFPETTAGVVYVVRNPLDVVVSYADHMDHTIDQAIDYLNNPNAVMKNWARELEGEERYVEDFISSWSNNVLSWIQNKRFPVLVVRYEDLLTDPQPHFEKMVGFIGGPFTKAQVKQAIELTSFNSLKEAESKQGFRELSKSSKSGTFFRQGKAQAWKDVLTPAQVKRVTDANGKLMQHFSYQV